MRSAQVLVLVGLLVALNGCTWRLSPSTTEDRTHDRHGAAALLALQEWAYPHNTMSSSFAPRTRQHWARFSTSDGIEHVFDFYKRKLELAKACAVRTDKDGVETCATSHTYTPPGASGTEGASACVVLLRTKKRAVSVHISRLVDKTIVFLVIQEL